MTPQKVPAIAGYTRVSTMDQGGESLPDQEKRIRDYAHSHGYTVFKIYSDKESGAEENRSNFQEMIRGAEQKKFSKIIFTQWDRLARDARDTLNYHHRLEKIGVALVCLALGIDTGTPEGKLTMTQAAAFSEYERKRIRERTQMGRLAKMRRREILSGKAPFGLKWNKEQRKIEVDPKEEKVYRQIVDWVLKDGLSLAEVNRQLKKGTHYFTTAKLSYIVRNRTYLGEFVVKLFDRDKKTGKKIPRPENEWIRFECPPLITQKDWERLNEKVQSRRSIPRHRVQNEYLLRGLLECEYCGSRLLSIGNNNYRYYQCLWAKKSPRQNLPKRIKERCSLPLIRADRLEDSVMRELYQFFMFPENLIKHWKNIQTPDVEQLQKDLEAVNQKLAMEGKAASKLFDLYESNRVDKIELERRFQKRKELIAQLREEKASLEAKIKSTGEREGDLASLKTSIHGLKKYSDKILKAIEVMPISQKRQFLIHCFEGNRIPVKALTQADILMYDGDEKGMTPEELAKPVIRRGKGKPIKETMISSSIHLGGFLKALEYLKTTTKIDFKTTTKSS